MMDRPFRNHASELLGGPTLPERFGRAPIGVMHLVDRLELGGAESVAVTLVNRLGSDRWRPILCTTRSQGPGIGAVDETVPTFDLGRRSRLDFGAIRRLAQCVRENDIRLLHAHSTSLFTAVAVRALEPRTRILWHAHFGKTPPPTYRDWAFAAALRGVSGVAAVSDEVKAWVTHRLKARQDRLWWLPNIVAQPSNVRPAADLPGEPGSRIVCVANLRPQKDHATLIAAFSQVVRDCPRAHLLLLGAFQDAETAAALRRQIRDGGLADNVSVLGPRTDVPAILAACDIGVLSSRHEGLPIALLEYGVRGLAAVATDVGDCRRVLDDGAAGIVCRAAAADEIAAGLTRLLRSPELRRAYGERLRERTERLHGPDAVIGQLHRIYDIVLQTEMPEMAPASCETDAEALSR